MGPNEQEYMLIHPEGPDWEWMNLLERYGSDKRDFIFKQMLKGENNIIQGRDTILNIDQLEGLGISAQTIVWIMMIIFLIVSIFLFK